MLLTVLAEITAVLAAMLQSSLLLQRSSTLWHSYCSQLRKRPLLTKAATGRFALGEQTAVSPEAENSRDGGADVLTGC